MASRSAQTQRTPVQIEMPDGSNFTCVCGSTEFRRTSGEEVPLHLFCKCGQVYTQKDLPEES